MLRHFKQTKHRLLWYIWVN